MGGGSGSASDSPANGDAAQVGGGGSEAGATPTSDAAAGTPGKVAGTISIFNGVSLNGWAQSAKNWWTVKDGVIDGKSSSGGEILMSAEDYGDFRIVVSSRMPFNSGGGHLGICFWGGRTPVGGYNRCKLYIPPNPWSWDYVTNTGLNKATFEPGAKVMDATVWHQAEILCRLATGHCLAAVDGKLVMTYTEVNLNTIKKGPIGLQIHAGNSEVQYKDAYINPAPQDDKLLTLVP